MNYYILIITELAVFILLIGLVIYNLFFIREVERAREQIKLSLPLKHRSIMIGNVVFSLVSTVVSAVFLLIFFFAR